MFRKSGNTCHQHANVFFTFNEFAKVNGTWMRTPFKCHTIHVHITCGYFQWFNTSGGRVMVMIEPFICSSRHVVTHILTAHIEKEWKFWLRVVEINDSIAWFSRTSPFCRSFPFPVPFIICTLWHVLYTHLFGSLDNCSYIHEWFV